MPLTAADYIRQSRITATVHDKSRGAPFSDVIKQTARSHFSAILEQTQAGYTSAAKVGKKCLASVNPIAHLGALYKVAAASFNSKIEPESDSAFKPFGSPYPERLLSVGSDDTVQESSGEDFPCENSFARIGRISAQYESGSLGSAAVGYDRNGGTSYGIYQLSSRAGTMSRFIEYLREHAPEWAERLSSCGPANTGSVHGRMPREWKRIAAEDPERLARLEYEFIKKSHYEEALTQVRELTGVDLSRSSAAVQEALWSTAVQHGPRGAAEIISRALGRATRTDGTVSDERLIHEIYSSRSRYFKASTRRVRAAVQQRFSEEKRVVLAMLKNGKDVQRA